MSRLWLVRTLWFFGGALTTAIVAYLVWAHYTSAGSADVEDIPALVLVAPAVRRRGRPGRCAARLT